VAAKIPIGGSKRRRRFAMSGPVSASAAEEEGPVAIICGGGPFPFVVADAVMRRGRPVLLFAIRGWADPAAVARYPHHWAWLGDFGWFLRTARAAACRDVVFIGTMLRPKLWQLRPDLTTLSYLPTVVRLLRGGDDHLLSGIGRVFEDKGFRLLGAHQVAPEILVPEGTLGRHAPSERDRADIARGLAVIRVIGPFDIGQAVVVADNYVLAVEAAEGTDRMLARVADLRRERRVPLSGKLGVLVKGPKPHQDRRLDFPSIGADTILAAAAAGLAGVAVEARGAITADLAAFIAAADAAGLFVVGVVPEAPRGRA
jgi:UDP-2,3-diacylglucosamine hydrolase